MAAQHISVTLRCHLMASFSMHILLSAVCVYVYVVKGLFIYVYIYICLYIYVQSNNCCWVRGRSNIRCVYIYITIYIHIYIYSYIYHSHPCLCENFMPFFHRSGSLLATKAEKNWTPKQDVSRQRYPGSRDLGRILFMFFGFCAQNPINTPGNGNKTIWKFV